MKARLLLAVANLPFLALFLQAADSPPPAEKIGMPTEVPSVAYGQKKKICRMVPETVIKKVPYTRSRRLPDGSIINETCYKNVPETICKPVWVEEESVPGAEGGHQEEAEAVSGFGEQPRARSKQLEGALAQLHLFPKDPYLQYVVLQLARREGRIDEVAGEVEEMAGGGNRRDAIDLFSIFTGALAVQESLQLDTMRGGAQATAFQPINLINRDPHSLPAPAPAPENIQQPEAIEPANESQELMQLEEVSKPEVLTTALPIADPAPLAPAAESLAAPAPAALETNQRPEPAHQYPETVAVAELHGPEVKSHPWEKMLAGRTPDIEPLARMVPDDFYYVHFRSLTKLLEVTELVDQLGTHFWTQASREARTQGTGERLKKQLALETNPELRPFYDLVVQDIAVVGSDPFIHEGSDVTVLIRYELWKVFGAKMEASMANAVRSRPDACRSSGEYRGIVYEHLATPDRAICVYAAYPADNIHIRSNSLTAFQRVIDALKGQTLDDKLVKRLGDSPEFAYIRTLYPLGAEEEDGLIYLSDPFIRRLVGPQLKLTERRRMLCYNHLRLIGHAAMLYRTEHGRAPESLEALYEAGCLPRPFHSEADGLAKERAAELLTDLESYFRRQDEFSPPNLLPYVIYQEEGVAELTEAKPVWCKPVLQEKLASQPRLEVAMCIERVLAEMGSEDACCCPDDGAYRLSADGMSGECSHHGHAHFLTPNLEIPVATVTGDEAREYDAFREQYNQYWRTYFDPIAIRVQATPERYRLETIVLPLIDNSIYKGLAAALGGQPENLNAGPVPKRNIFSMALRLNKEALLKEIDDDEKEEATETPDEAEDEEVSGDEEETEAPAEPTYPLPIYAPKPDRVVLNELCAELLKDWGISDKELELDKLDVNKFLKEGIGSQVGLHLYDAPPNFDFNLSAAIGFLMQMTGGSGASIDNTDALMGLSYYFLIAGVGASFNGPVYVTLPVQDAKVVDEFGDQLERVFAAIARRTEASFHGLGGVEFYRVPFNYDPDREMRVLTVRYGPLKLRYFWGRVGNVVYIASQPCVLDDMLVLENQEAQPAKGESPAHAMVKIRAQNWDAVLDNTYLGWAENHRAACIDNLGPLSSVARAFTPAATTSSGLCFQAWELLNEQIVREADRLHGVHFFCPAGGYYVLSPDGKEMTCTVHGSPLAPRQPAGLEGNSPVGQYLKQFGGLTATLTFLEEGLRAVVELERK